MRILIDGCDGTGKTSVAEKLANCLNCDIIRLTHNGDGSFRKYMEVMIPENMVHDRTFISELIYPKYFGRKSKLDEGSEMTLFNLLEQYDCKVFIFTAAESELKKRLKARGDDFLKDFEQVKNINRDYLQIAYMYEFEIIDTTYKTVEEVVYEIERKIR